MANIVLSYQHTTADYVEFYQYYMLKGRGRRFFVILAVALGGMMLYQLWCNNWATVAAILVFCLVFIPVYWIMLKRSATSIAQHMPQFLEPRTVTINQSGIEVQATTFTTDYQWAGIVKTVETKAAFLLFSSAVSALIIPKSAFEAEQLAQFKKLIIQ
jgi:YcxB-like protein